MIPEFDSKAAYEACAPLHWDVEEWDFQAWLEDDGDGDVGAVPPIKHRKFSGTYWW
jgi:hypothetical protein